MKLLLRALAALATALGTASLAFAADTAKREIIVPWLGTPRAYQVDTIEYAAAMGWRVTINGASVVPTHDNADAEPEYIFTEADWNTTENWVDFPVSVSIPEYDETTGEFIRYYNRRYNRAASLEKLLAENNQPCPPHKWPGFNLFAKTSCNTQGHVYGADCVCLNCGAQREHKFTSASQSKCARCVNKFDEYTVGKGGVFVKTGNTLDTECGAKMPTAYPMDTDLPEAYHGGFHKEKTDSEKYNCSCECGYFAFSAVKLAHDFDSDDQSSWQPENPYTGETDEVQHWRYALCMRCEQAEEWTGEDHRIAANTQGRTDGDSTYIDEDAHSAPGTCADCGYSGEIREAHDIDENCLCHYCNTYCHTWKQYSCGSLGSASNLIKYYACTVCGKSGADTNADGKIDIEFTDPAFQGHSYGIPYPEDHALRATHHSCYCETYSQAHNFGSNSICTVCGYKLESVKSGGHRDPNCAKRGYGDHVHNGDRSHNALRSTCPDVPGRPTDPPIDPNTLAIPDPDANPDADPDAETATVTVTTNDWANLYTLGDYFIETPNYRKAAVISGSRIPPIYATRKRDGVEESYPLTPYPKKGAQVMGELEEAIAKLQNVTSGTFMAAIRWNCLPISHRDDFTGQRKMYLIGQKMWYLYGEVKCDESGVWFIEWK